MGVKDAFKTIWKANVRDLRKSMHWKAKQKRLTESSDVTHTHTPPPSSIPTQNPKRHEISVYWQGLSPPPPITSSSTTTTNQTGLTRPKPHGRGGNSALSESQCNTPKDTKSTLHHAERVDSPETLRAGPKLSHRIRGWWAQTRTQQAYGDNRAVYVVVGLDGVGGPGQMGQASHSTKWRGHGGCGCSFYT